MIEYHADDYGLLPEQSRHIMDCYHNGALNGISIMPNSPYLKQCMDEIADIRKNLFITVHLNFVEGKPLVGKKASLLINNKGNFNISFFKLLLFSYVPVLRILLKEQLKREIEAQIDACGAYMNDGKYRLDGHVHYHMIPVVFDAMMDVVKEKELKVSYIRFPKENINIYRRNLGKLKGIGVMNTIKVLVLNTLCARNERKYNETLRQLQVENKLFMGVMLSGHMFYENVKPCIETAADLMADMGLNDMEVLFHPGDVSAPEDIDRLTSKDDLNFLTSKNRFKEADAIKKFGCNLKR